MDQVGLTGAKQTQKDVEDWTRRMSGPMVNLSFVPDETPTANNFSPMEEKVKPSEKGIYMVDMNSKEKLDDEYDPYEHRQVQHPTTNAETLIHLLKGSLGTGILAMPHAFSQSGYIVGLVGTAFIGILCTYCVHILIDSCYQLCKRRKVPSMTYTGAAEAALYEGPNWCKSIAPYAAHIVNTFLLIYQIGTCCVYVVFIAENMKAVLDPSIGPLNLELYMLMILLPLIFINWVRDLKYLAPFSAVANAVTLVGFAIILYYIFRDPISTEGKVAVGNVAQFPLFFGTVLFALEAIGVILPLENEMKTPKAFITRFGVLNIAMFNIIILYVGMGLFGYLRFGNAVEGSITLNLTGTQESLAKAVQGMLAFAIFITHSLACYVAIEIIWNDYISSKVKSNSRALFWEYTVRTLIVLLTFGIAAAVPALDLFISLFGALCLSALGLAFPALIQMATYWNYCTKSERIRMIIKNIIIIIIGLFGLVVGTYTSLDGIIKRFGSKS